MAEGWTARQTVEARAMICRAGERPLTEAEREAYMAWYEDPANHPGSEAYIEAVRSMVDDG